MASITLDGNTLLYQTPYNPALVAALKSAVPASDRRWDPSRKVWQVAPQHGPVLVRLAQQYLGESLSLPKVGASMPEHETRILDVRYIGATKDRGDGAPSAFAYIDGQWGAIFPGVCFMNGSTPNSGRMKPRPCMPPWASRPAPMSLKCALLTAA